MKRSLLVFALVALFIAPAAQAQVDARLLRHPDVSETHITFVYGGDIWTVPKTGGTAQRLTTPAGEESFPRFAPDGQAIAFSGNYDGNTDVYTIPAGGGAPTRVTYHENGDRLIDWMPSGDALLIGSSRSSGRQRYNQLYRVDAAGGLPEQLPVSYGEFGAMAPDGQALAFTPKSRLFRTWKRYRGGMAPDIWLYRFGEDTATNITDHPANDELPMWSGTGTLYFLSDRGSNQRANIWAYDLDTEQMRQVTSFSDFDVHAPAIGPSDLVFEAGGQLYRMDLATEEAQTVDINVVTDRAPRLPRTATVGDQIQSFHVSPSGKRAVVQARGELFSVPAEHGVVRNLTQTSGAAERTPAWSPDGEKIAYFSDASGEYQLVIHNADGSGTPEMVTDLGAGFRYQPYWSPDSEQLAFIDEAQQIHVYDTASGELQTIDQGLWMTHGGLDNFAVSWSPDSRWLAYDRGLSNRHDAVFLYDTQSGERHQVTSGYYAVSQPVFDPAGDYLFVRTMQHFSPVYSNLDNSFAYPNATQIAAIPLREDVPSPLHPRNDVETNEDAQNEDAEEGEEERDADASDAVAIDLDGFEERLVTLPATPGNYPRLAAAEGKVIYHRAPRSGSGDEQAPIVMYDLDAREEQTILDDADSFVLSADGSTLLVFHEGRLAMVDVAPNQSFDAPLATDELSMTLDPVAEWQQLFREAWRLQRDYFYDPNLHGVDWDQLGDRYGALIDDAATRSDVNFIIGELIAELNASHTYRGGGDTESAEQRSVGFLGVDWAVDGGAYQIERIVEGATWDSEVRSPLDEPGVDVSAGDYVLAVNGTPLDPAHEPWAALQGLSGETVALTVNSGPSMDGAREVVVDLLTEDEMERLRYLDWVEQKRQYVDERTDGRVGYVYVPDTGVDGQSELVRQFNAQFEKEALIIDERFNSGGQIPDRFIELLNRPAKAFWAVRHGRDWQWPPVAHYGPKTMLINGWSGSGGDAFPDFFRKAELGPLIGTRTWGGLIGISGSPGLIDGGVVTVPTFRQYEPDGRWFAEGYGVDPDVRVVNDPAVLYQGRDQQLDRAIEAMLDALDTYDPPQPDRPPYENRTPTDNGNG
jgi:tricorn protease